MWEAFEHAGWEGLDNLIAIIDVNRLGQTRETMLGWDLDGYADADPRRSAGTRSRSTATTSTRSTPPTPRPRTTNGQADGDHRPHQEGQGRQGGRGPARQARQAARRSRGGDRGARRRARPARSRSPSPRPASRSTFETPGGELPTWDLGEEVATRKAYGEALAALGAIDGDVVALDGEVSNSTHSEDFREAHPDRYFEMFIAEQQLVAGRGRHAGPHRWKPFASTFSAFFSRAYDFIRMAAISRARHPAGRLARRRVDRRGRAVADGARGHRLHARDPLLDRAAPVRRQPGGEADRGDGRPRRASRSCARCARKTPVRTPRRRGRSRSAAAASSAPTATTSRSSPAASRSTRRCARPRRSRARASGPACIDCYSIKPIDAETLQGRRARVRRDRHGRGPLARGRPRRRGARGARRRRRPRRRSPSSRCARCPSPARRRSCCTPPGSTRRRSPPPRAASSAPAPSAQAHVVVELPALGRQLLGGVDRSTGTARRSRATSWISWVVSCAPQTAQLRSRVSSSVRSSRSMTAA